MNLKKSKKIEAQKIEEEVDPEIIALIEDLVETDDDDMMHNLEELIASHPMIAKRIDEIRNYSKTQAYVRLRSLMDQNLSG